MDKTYDKIVSPAPEFIGLEKAKQIALKDAGLDETAQKIVFTREELSRNSGKPCYILEFYTDKCVFPTRSMQYPGKLSGRKPSGFPVRSPRLCRTRLKIPIPSSAGETNQNMTRSSHRKWGQAINACPHFAKSNRLVGAIFAKHIGSVFFCGLFDCCFITQQI